MIDRAELEALKALSHDSQGAREKAIMDLVAEVEFLLHDREQVREWGAAWRARFDSLQEQSLQQQALLRQCRATFQDIDRHIHRSVEKRAEKVEAWRMAGPDGQVFLAGSGDPAVGRIEATAELHAAVNITLPLRNWCRSELEALKDIP